MSESASSTLQKNSSDTSVAIEFPKKYNVIFHNDDITPIGFVVEILVMIFSMDQKTALSKVVEVEKNGRAVVGTYIRPIAEHKTQKSIELANKNGFPLNVTTEEAN